MTILKWRFLSGKLGAECLAHAFSGQHIVDFTTPITNIFYSKYDLHTSYIKER